jgi:penicillin G amidase
LTHGTSPLVSWGLTAINPDVSDVYVEKIKENLYLSANDEWVQVDTKTETIKVRFGSDVELPLRFTRNGVVITDELLDGAAHDLVPWVSKDIL